MTVQAMCGSAGVSRAGYYRHCGRPEVPDKDTELRDAMQKVALEWPAYGRRRVTAELKRRGWQVNHKRVHRMMREDNLLCLRRRKFLTTTDSNHNRPVYPNVAAAMQTTGTDQLWVADITYIRLQSEFVYLAVVLDAHSRRVIGWSLDRTMEAGLPLSALRMALDRRSPAAGLVHHSDRGSVYASKEYTDVLKDYTVEAKPPPVLPTPTPTLVPKQR